MLAGADRDRVKFLFNFVELAEVRKAFGLRIFFLCRIECHLGHITDRDDVFTTANLPHITAASAASTNNSNVQFAVKILSTQESWSSQRPQSCSG